MMGHVKSLATASLLVTGASADTFKSTAHGFQVDFPKAPYVWVENDGDRASWEWSDLQHGQGRPNFVAIHVVPARPLSADKAYKEMLQTLPSSMQASRRTFAGHPAWNLTGLMADGVPIQAMMVVVSERSQFFVGAADYDLAAGERFLRSFRLVAPQGKLIVPPVDPVLERWKKERDRRKRR